MNHSGMTKRQPALPFLAASVSLLFLLAAPATFAKSTTAPSDNTFAKDAAMGNVAEIKLGQLAEQKGATEQVKDFGKRMVQDHTKIDDNLKSATSDEKIQLPDQMSAKDQAMYDRLSKLSGTAFDKAYARDMVNEHEADISTFKHEASDGTNASIKNFASQSLPTLQEHLKLAQQMYSATSATNSATRTKNSGA